MAFRRGLKAAAALALAGCAGLDRDEVRCEEAVAGVKACCPALTRSPVVCEPTQSAVSPYVWSFPNVDCLIGLSCAELTARGVCAWAGDPADSGVCP